MTNSARCLLLSVAMLLAGPVHAEQQAIPWPPAEWNPNPDASDFVLPLPCGGSMAFRVVSSGVRGILDDREIVMGAPDENASYSEYMHKEYVAGSFTGLDGQRFYYIGKYEVTERQYAAVMQNQCPADPGSRSALPMADLSWFDAVEFTRRLNGRLFADSLDRLPKEAGQPGFVRLPTEVEWEFAARGGLAVSDGKRTDRTFLPDGAQLHEYVWYAGPEFADGEIRLIGSLKPNPLGIYDMLGNVEEFVIEPFRLNRAGRLHGQPGGFVVRGGSIDTPREEIRASLRTEFPFFSGVDRGEMRFKTFGLRIVIGAAALGSEERIKAARVEWQKALQQSALVDEASRMQRGPVGETPLETLRRLAKETRDPELRRKLVAIEAVLAAETGKRNEFEGRAAKSLILNAAQARRALREIALPIDELSSMMRDDSFSERQRKLFADKRCERLREFQLHAATYVDLIQQLAQDFSFTAIQLKGRELTHELTARQRESLVNFVSAAIDQVRRYASEGLRESDAVIRSVLGDKPWLAERC